MNVLVIAAHPDDEVLGCGATIARLAGEGHAVRILIAAEGATSRYDAREKADAAEVDALRALSVKVGALLGAKSVEHLGFPDNRLDTVPLLDVIKPIERAIAAAQPEIIFTHHAGDLNVDHRILAGAVLTATRPTSANGVREIYQFEVPSSTEWAFGTVEPAFRADTFVDVAATLEKKIQAMQLYEVEARAFPHPRSPEALTALARVRGSSAGVRAAEAFSTARRIWR